MGYETQRHRKASGIFSFILWQNYLLSLRSLNCPASIFNPYNLSIIKIQSVYISPRTMMRVCAYVYIGIYLARGDN